MIKQMGSWTRNAACVLFAAAFAVTSISALAKDEKTRYPNASRHEPKSDLTNPGDQKALQTAIDNVTTVTAAVTRQKTMDRPTTTHM